jgi:tripartite-type tricarboxylate transporter receptor subunit TctC
MSAAGALTIRWRSFLSDGFRRRHPRALAVTTSTRLAAAPDIPTISEFVPGYDASTWFGIGAPRNTPSEIIARLNQEINAGLADPKLKTRFADMGGEAFPLAPSAFGRFIAEETEKWAKVVKFSGATPD